MRDERNRRGLGAIVLAGALLTVASCGSDSKAGSVKSTDASSGPATTGASPDGTMDPGMSMKTTYPVTIKDCDGRETTYAKAPERVVTIDPNITEMLLLLGLKDRVVGYTEFYTPDRQWGPTKADMGTLKMINDGSNYPSKEAVVAESPDLVTSIYSYAFMDPLPDRSGWSELGVNTYQSLGECLPTAPKDFSLLYEDLRNFGIMFDVQDKAEVEIAKLQARVAVLQQRAKDANLTSHRIAIHDGSVEHPGWYTGTINIGIGMAGSTYIWSDLGPEGVATWEEFVARDPDVIWIIPDAGTDVAVLEQQLQDDPRLANVTAVKNKAYIVIPQSDATVESPREIDGLEQMIDALLALQ